MNNLTSRNEATVCGIIAAQGGDWSTSLITPLLQNPGLGALFRNHDRITQQSVRVIYCIVHVRDYVTGDVSKRTQSDHAQRCHAADCDCVFNH